jgi:hypothetical protein
MAATAALLLSGCGIIGEERMSYMKRDWERLKGPAWSDSADRLGWETVLPTASSKERANEETICEHPNTRVRVVAQDGVNDQVSYTRCPLSPYDVQAGSRLGIRPDGNRAFAD